MPRRLSVRPESGVYGRIRISPDPSRREKEFREIWLPRVSGNEMMCEAQLAVANWKMLIQILEPFA